MFFLLKKMETVFQNCLVGNVMLVPRSVPKIRSLELEAWSLELTVRSWSLEMFFEKFFNFSSKKNALFYSKKKCYGSLLEVASWSSRLIRKVQASSSTQISKLQDRLGFYGSVLADKKELQMGKNLKKKME